MIITETTTPTEESAVLEARFAAATAGLADILADVLGEADNGEQD